jgi:hypothetical protein
MPREPKRRRFPAKNNLQRAPHSPALQKVTPRPWRERGEFGLNGFWQGPNGMLTFPSYDAHMRTVKTADRTRPDQVYVAKRVVIHEEMHLGTPLRARYPEHRNANLRSHR